MRRLIPRELNEPITVARPGLRVSVVGASDFHDRFRTPDRSLGVIIGSSLNKIDSFSTGDVAAVLREVDGTLNS